MADYSVTITNGTGSASMKAGQYTVAATSVAGYAETSLTPTSFTVTDAAATGNFTVEAEGTLTMVFNETGAEGGTPITSGTVVMTDSTGTTQYGTAVTIDATGTATFEKVPYGDGTTPFTLYFKQLTTDDNHNIESDVITVAMAAQTQTAYVQNTALALQTINLTDATYTDLPVASATLTFGGA